MDFLQALILGIVEGLTEFLPISSTGHLILASDFLGIEQTEFVKTFQIAIQSGAALAVIFFYRQTLIHDTELVKRVLVSFIPTAIIGFTLYSFIRESLLGNPTITLSALFLGGIALIGVELLLKTKKNSKSSLTTNHSPLSYERAFVIGLFQSLSMIPGVSRAAATIIGGILVGMPRIKAVEFSFLLAIPTIFAATALDLNQTDVFNLNADELLILAVGIITSFVVALIAIKWLLRYVENHTFIPFGIYRIVLSILYFLFILG